MTRVTPPRAAPTLFDQFGRNLDPFAPPRDPLDEESKSRALIVRRDIPIVTASGSWTIDNVRQALAAHMMGQFLGSANLCDAIIADERVQATLGSRTGGLFGQPVRHVAATEDPDADMCRAAWVNAWPALSTVGAMSDVLRWAIVMGFVVCEILWDTTWQTVLTLSDGTEVQSELWQPTLKIWHPQFIRYRFDLRKYVAITQDGEDVITPGDGHWFLYAPHGEYRGWVQGAVRAVADKWLIKNYAWRDWARFNERHGLPIIKAKVPAAGDPDQKANFIQSMSTLGQEAVVGLPQNVDGTGYDLDLLEARDRAWESFKGTIDRCDTAIVLPILWQNLTTEVKEGSFAAARTHGDVRQNAIEFDEQTFSEAIYQQIARPFADFNFGNRLLAPRTRWDVTPPEDHVATSRVLQTFTAAVLSFREAGYQLDAAAVRSLAAQYGIKLGNFKVTEPLIGGGTKTSTKEPEKEDQAE